jgi:hypothetical protein
VDAAYETSSILSIIIIQDMVFFFGAFAFVQFGMGNSHAKAQSSQNKKDKT